jgi:hypothetical protein
MPNRGLAGLEKKRHWQATAQYKDGSRTAVMKGVPGGPRAASFFLYDEKASMPQPPDQLQAYSAQQIQDMFRSGDLSLIKGTVPD